MESQRTVISTDSCFISPLIPSFFLPSYISFIFSLSAVFLHHHGAVVVRTVSTLLRDTGYLKYVENGIWGLSADDVIDTSRTGNDTPLFPEQMQQKQEIHRLVVGRCYKLDQNIISSVLVTDTAVFHGFHTFLPNYMASLPRRP
jgi:hypothetical protein